VYCPQITFADPTATLDCSSLETGRKFNHGIESFEDPLASLPNTRWLGINATVSLLNFEAFKNRENHMDSIAMTREQKPLTEQLADSNPLAMVPWQAHGPALHSTGPSKCLKVFGLLKQRPKCKLLGDLVDSSPEFLRGGKRQKKLKKQSSSSSSRMRKEIVQPSDSDINRINSRLRNFSAWDVSAIPFDAKEEARQMVILGKQLVLSFFRTE